MLASLDGFGRGKKSLKLSDFRIDDNASSRWQKVASIKEQAFETYIGEAWENGGEITEAGLFRYAGVDPLPPTTIVKIGAR